MLATLMTAKPRILFLCTHNAARSQMAEALLRHLAGDRFEACSAGFEPTEVHPLTRSVLAEVGIDADGLRVKDVKEPLGRVAITHAIVVCERAEEMCPRLYPFALTVLHWPFDDPAAVKGTDAAPAAFRRVRNQIKARLREWLAQQGPSGTARV